MQEIVEIFKSQHFYLSFEWGAEEWYLAIFVSFCGVALVNLIYFEFYKKFLMKNGNETLSGAVSIFVVFFLSIIIAAKNIHDSFLKDKARFEEDARRLALFEKQLSPDQLKKLNLSIAEILISERIEAFRKPELKEKGKWSPTDENNAREIQFNQKIVLGFLSHEEERLKKALKEQPIIKMKEDIKAELKKLDNKDKNIFKQETCLLVCEKN